MPAAGTGPFDWSVKNLKKKAHTIVYIIYYSTGVIYNYYNALIKL